ncbi:hypothetical protein GHT06_008706 [Daphnia sinensis]|uniref:Transmembrane protein n=1 Tax=Daphnia sinensis TaxID=1820382 RepID=A0AAD5LMX0_9CRUS|nr:hypothetical protein GHT06_008706 [Daphnia sinensis]
MKTIIFSNCAIHDRNSGTRRIFPIFFSSCFYFKWATDNGLGDAGTHRLYTFYLFSYLYFSSFSCFATSGRPSVSSSPRCSISRYGSAKIGRRKQRRVAMHDSECESLLPAEFQITPSGRNRHECYTRTSFVRSLFHIHLTLLSVELLLSGLFVPGAPSGLSSPSLFFGALFVSSTTLRGSKKDSEKEKRDPSCHKPAMLPQV